MKRRHILLCLLLAGGLSPAQDQPPSGAPTPAEGETIVPPSEQISEAAARRELARLRRLRQRPRKPAIGKPSTGELVDRRIGQAEALAGEQRYEEAIQFLTRLRAEYPGDPKVILALARVLSWSHRFNESIQTYAELGRMTPGNPTVWKEMARVAIWDKQMGLARACYAKIYTPSVDEKLAKALRR